MSDFALPGSIAAPQPRSAFGEAWLRQRQVLWALMLHDIKSRFFGNGLGYVVTILWPSAHIAIIVSIFVLGRRPVPYGNSAFLYAATGVLPYIAWNYISRFVLLACAQNRGFLGYPVIRPLDIMIARLALEHVSIFVITIGLLFLMALCQVDIVPMSLAPALLGMLSAVLLGIGFGIFNGVIVMIFPLWNLVYVLFLIIFWFTAGLAINPESLPYELGYWISWNPLMHSVEWVRTGYYADFPAHLLDKTYVISVGAGSLALGLMMERALRRFTSGA